MLRRSADHLRFLPPDELQRTTNPNHVAGGFPQHCTLCHNTTSWTGATFNHSTTRFPLTGAHASAQCSSCHGATLCRPSDHLRFLPPRALQGRRIRITSRPASRRSARPATIRLPGRERLFNHSTTRFPLTGAHTSAQCSTCHASVVCRSSDHLRFLPPRRLQRTTNPNHAAAGFPQDCTLCHNTTSWTGATVQSQHDTIPADRRAYKRSSALPVTDNGLCRSCRKPAFPATWRITTERRIRITPGRLPAGLHPLPLHNNFGLGPLLITAQTQFPLTGSHTVAQCSTCHKNNVYAGLPTTCVSCHLADYSGTTNPNHTQAGFPQECSLCHSTTTWAGATFNHNTTPFPLTGVHVNVACALCHIGNRFAGTPMDCYSCHSAVYKTTTNPNHQAAGFPNTCQTCHSTTAWTGATFNHAYFPLRHGNANGVCATCHTNPSDYSVFTCTNCHTKAQTDSHHRGVNGYVYNSVNCYQCHRNGNGG